jgi:sulfite reductase alpha subunit-like flavoprotein
MEEWIVKDIFLKAKKSLEKMNDSLRLFKEFVEEGETQDLKKYYLARTFLKDGRKFFEEMMKDAKKFLGPLPAYLSKEIVEARTQLLKTTKVVVLSQDYEGLVAELLGDEFMKSFMSSEEINAFLKEHYQKQQLGKRKLPNIKARMVIDKLQRVERQALAGQKRASEEAQKKV